MGRQAARQWPEAAQCVRKREQQPRDSNSPEPQFVMTVWTTCQNVSPHLLAPESSPNVLSHLDITRERACMFPAQTKGICLSKALPCFGTAEPASDSECSKHLWVRRWEILPVFTSTDEFEPSGHFNSLPSAHITFFLSTLKSCRRMLNPGTKIRKHVYTCYICSRISSLYYTFDFHIPPPPPSCLVKRHHVKNNPVFFPPSLTDFLSNLVKTYSIWKKLWNGLATEASAGCSLSSLSRIFRYWDSLWTKMTLTTWNMVILVFLN